MYSNEAERANLDIFDDFKFKKPFGLLVYIQNISALLRIGQLNPFKPEITIAILIHYKPRIAVAILDL